MSVRGDVRERNLGREVYYSENYFALHQLCSFAHQLHDIYRIGPKSVLEVGIGNGFTSTFLKRAGFDITTVDINRALEPDVCASIDEMPSRLGGMQFDLVVCCEVLEHMPFDFFDQNLEILRSFSKNLYLTLPSYKRVFGFGGLLRIPKVGARNVSLFFEFPINKQLDREHYWEVGSSADTSVDALRQILWKRYKEVTTRRYALNPYHRSFTCFA